MSDRKGTVAVLPSPEDTSEQTLQALLDTPTGSGSPAPQRIDGVIVGRLIGFVSNGDVPLVAYPTQPRSAAVPARATLDLQAHQIGRDVVLMFEEGNPLRPIIVGCLQKPHAEVPEFPGHVEVDRDGQRMLVSAREQIVLQCGKASITLTRSGKIIIQGTYVSNRSSGVMRVKGGSVQIN